MSRSILHDLVLLIPKLQWCELPYIVFMLLLKKKRIEVGDFLSAYKLAFTALKRQAVLNHDEIRTPIDP